MKENNRNPTPADPIAEALARCERARASLAATKERSESMSATLASPASTEKLLISDGPEAIVRLASAIENLPIESRAAQLELCRAEEALYALRAEKAEQEFKRACGAVSRIEAELAEVNQRYARAISQRESSRYLMTELQRTSRERKRQASDLAASFKPMTAPVVRSLPHMPR
jgi:hypothetical protein